MLDSFQADVGKTIDIELLKEKATCEVREVTAAGIKVNQIIKQGQGPASWAGPSPWANSACRSDYAAWAPATVRN